MKIMIKTILNVSLLTIGSLFFCLSCSNEPKEPVRKLFEAKKISTNFVEHSITFSDDRTELYFTRSTGKWGQGGGKSAIYFSVLTNGEWSKPKIASFSGEYNDSAPHLCDNGKTLYFTSTRPTDSIIKASKDIWKVQKNTDNTWGIPQRLDNPINSERSEYSPRTDKMGNLYFASNRAGGLGQGDIYWVKKEKDGFGLPINLGSVINSEYGEWNVTINNNGDMLIFESSGRDENLSPYGDLYISFKTNNRWSIPQHIIELNTTGSDLYAEFVKEGDLLYYASSDSLKSVDTNIYAIEFHQLQKKYRKNATFPE